MVCFLYFIFQSLCFGFSAILFTGSLLNTRLLRLLSCILLGLLACLLGNPFSLGGVISMVASSDFSSLSSLFDISTVFASLLLVFLVPQNPGSNVNSHLLLLHDTNYAVYHVEVGYDCSMVVSTNILVLLALISTSLVIPNRHIWFSVGLVGSIFFLQFFLCALCPTVLYCCRLM